jgi:C1A family cysteine protease
MSGKSDWRQYCSPIQDQGDCGSCSAFGTTGVMEAIIRIKDNFPAENVKLSEQDVLACSGGSCEYGNTMPPVFDKLIRGVATEDCCPYQAVTTSCGDGRCDNWWLTGKKISAETDITDVAKMKQLLDTHPLVTTMMVHESFFHYAGSGVYHSLGPQDAEVGGHCVGIVGYDDQLGAWILRNSWGKGWGVQGYCWIAYGDSNVDDTMYDLTPDGPVSPDQPSIWDEIIQFLKKLFHITK